MYNPTDIFTPHGLLEYQAYLFNLKKALNYITNNADDLHIGSSEEGDQILQLMYELQEKLEGDLLMNGDGEKIDG